LTVLPLLFWLALLLPGFAIARRVVPRELESGPLPSIAVAWTAALSALVLPIALFYILGSVSPATRVPIGALAIATACFIAWGAVDVAVHLAAHIARTRTWDAVGRALIPFLSIAGAVILADVVLADRHGAILDNDSRVHIARIRFLLDHGLSNVDPFVRTPIEYPYPIYHTNILHALCAIASKLLALDPVTVWFNTLAASRLMIASGVAYLAWAAVGGAWAPWIAALIVVVNRGPYPFTLYPNQLAPWAFMPIAIGATLRALWPAPRALAAALNDPAPVAVVRVESVASPTIWRILAMVALPTALVGMLHPLYAGFLFVVAAPVVAVVVAWRVMHRVRRVPTGCVRTALVVFAGIVVPSLAFPLASKALTAPPIDKVLLWAANQVDDGVAREVGAESAPASVDEEASADPFGVAPNPKRSPKPPPRLVRPQDGFDFYERGDDDWIARRFGRGFTGGWSGIVAWRVWLAALGIGVLCWSLARRRSGAPLALIALAGMVAMVLVVTMIPPMCTAALKVLGAQWVLGRFEMIAFVLWIPLGIPAIAGAVEAWRRWTSAEAFALSSACACAAIPVASLHASQSKPYTWSTFIDAALKSEGVRNGRQHAGLMRQKAWMDEAIPRDAIVLAGPLTGTWISMLHGADTVASERSSTGIASGRLRREHVDEMFDPVTDEARRAELFDLYGVTHVLTRGRTPSWARYWTVGGNRRHGHVVLKLRPKPDESLMWMRGIDVARAQLDRGNIDGAVTSLREVLAEHPDAVDAWFTLGVALARKGEHEASLQPFITCESLEPADPVHPLMHGNALAALRRFDEACASFEHAARLAGDAGDPFAGAAAEFNLGNALYELDRVDDALASYERAIALDPAHAKAATARGWLRQDLGLDPIEPTEPSTSPTP
jgi:predicted negative regulator of RcsB-dependent stress response